MDPSPTRLPYDIFIPVIEELASQRCYKDLRACSQTCHMLLHPCRVHLFSTIHIDINNAHQFAALLKGNSTIPSYVQNLTFQHSILTEDVANALLLLNKIRTFVFCDFHYTRSWDSLTPHVQHALQHLFSSPSITQISISQSSHFPAILLSSCSNLKHLVIRRQVSFTSEMCDTVLDARRPPKLLSLDISGVTIPAMVGMRRRFLENILSECLTLEHLSISAIQHSIPDDMLQTIRIVLPTLRSLKLEWWLHADQISFEFPEVIKALEGLTHQPNCITELQLLMWMPGSHTWADQDWGRIDHILADRSNFQKLERVDLKLWVYQGASDYEKQKHLRKFKTTKLPLLCSAKDYLDFTILYF